MWTVDTVGYSVQSCWLLQFLLKAETPDFEGGGGREGGRKVRETPDFEGGGKGGRKEGEGHQNPKACFK